MEAEVNGENPCKNYNTIQQSLLLPRRFKPQTLLLWGHITNHCTSELQWWAFDLKTVECLNKISSSLGNMKPHFVVDL